jgi:hypothetical protein
VVLLRSAPARLCDVCLGSGTCLMRVRDTIFGSRGTRNHSGGRLCAKAVLVVTTEAGNEKLWCSSRRQSPRTKKHGVRRDDRAGERKNMVLVATTEPANEKTWCSSRRRSPGTKKQGACRDDRACERKNMVLVATTGAGDERLRRASRLRRLRSPGVILLLASEIVTREESRREPHRNFNRLRNAPAAETTQP